MKKNFTLSGLMTQSESEEHHRNNKNSNTQEADPQHPQQFDSPSRIKFNHPPHQPHPQTNNWNYSDAQNHNNQKNISRATERVYSASPKQTQSNGQEYLQFEQFRVVEDGEQMKQLIMRDFEAAAARQSDEQALKEYYQREIRHRDVHIDTLYKMLDDKFRTNNNNNNSQPIGFVTAQNMQNGENSNIYRQNQALNQQTKEPRGSVSSQSQKNNMKSSGIMTSSRVTSALNPETEKIIVQKDQRYEELLQRYQELTEVLRSKNDEIAKYRYENYRLLALVDSFQQQSYIKHTKQTNKRLTQQFFNSIHCYQEGLNNSIFTNNGYQQNGMYHNGSMILTRQDHLNQSETIYDRGDTVSVKNIEDLQKRLQELKSNRLELELNKTKQNWGSRPDNLNISSPLPKKLLGSNVTSVKKQHYVPSSQAQKHHSNGLNNNLVYVKKPYNEGENPRHVQMNLSQVMHSNTSGGHDVNRSMVSSKHANGSSGGNRSFLHKLSRKLS